MQEGLEKILSKGKEQGNGWVKFLSSMLRPYGIALVFARACCRPRLPPEMKQPLLEPNMCPKSSAPQPVAKIFVWFADIGCTLA